MFGLGYSSNQVFVRDQAILKRYGAHGYKLVLMRTCRLPGFEARGPLRGKRNSAGHVRKLNASISRSRSKVFELALCNSWEYFVTITFDGGRVDRYDLPQLKRAFAKWINNLNSRSGDATKIKYLLIPERHADGAWHMHGLFMGIPANRLRAFSLEEHLPHAIRAKLQTGTTVYNWPAYAKKFGYVTVEPIRDLERCAKYITKYITKELGESMIAINEKLYLCSHGLSRAAVVRRGPLSCSFVPDYCNEYVALKSFPPSALEEALGLFDDRPISDLLHIGFLDLVSPYLRGDFAWNNCPSIPL